MSQIGSIYINLLADTAKFTSGMAKASNQLSRFAQQADGALRNVEKGLQQFGTRMTTRVTLPITAFGVAALRAADQNKQAQQSIERMGLQAQKALEPLGRVLADSIEQVRPAIESGIRAVNGLAAAFEKLDPKTQRTIVGVAAAVAAVGPLSIALAAGTTAVRAFSTGLLLPVAHLTKVTAAALASGAAIKGLVGTVAAAGVAFTAFTFGQTLYEQFRWVQEGMANAVWAVQRGVASIELAFGTMVAQLKQTFADLMTLFNRLGGSDYLFNAISAVSPNAANDFARFTRQFDQRALDDLGNMDARLEELNRAYEARRSEIDAIRSTSMQGIGATFDGPGGQTFDPAGAFADNLRANMAKVRSALDEALDPSAIGDGYDRLMEKIRGVLEAGTLPFVQTKAEADAAAKAISDAADAMKRLEDQARQMREESLPAERISRQMGELEKLRDLFPTIISPDVFEDQAKRIMGVVDKVQERVVNFGDKLKDTISGFADDAGNALARFAVKGEGSFKDLAEAWAEQLLAMALTTQAFKPLFDALGAGFGSIFGAGTGTSTSPSVDVKSTAGASVSAQTASVASKIGSLGGSGGDVVVQVYDYRGSGAAPEVSRGRSGDGRNLIKITIRDAVKEMVGDGGLDTSLTRRYGIKPRPVY